MTPNEQKAREELIVKLGSIVKIHSNSGISHKLSYTMKRWELELVADFIMADRKRIVEEYKLSVECHKDKYIYCQKQRKNYGKP